MYPDSALSGGALAVIAVVVTAALAAWLIMVFLAAREPHRSSAAAKAGRHGEQAAAEHHGEQAGAEHHGEQAGTATRLRSDDKRSGRAAALPITWRCDDQADSQAPGCRCLGLAG